MKRLYFTLLMISCQWSIAQTAYSLAEERKIIFPNVEGYQTLVCDFHMHTVFSDGSVWPDVRVQEALKDGLDAIAMTDHIEYQPHSTDIPHPDRNRSYEVASKVAEDEPLLVINGSEITRSMPPGHCNAIFIQDANKFAEKDEEGAFLDPIIVFREAKNQGAFAFWNHPNWTAQYKDGIAKLTDLHRKLIEEGLLSGIEVVNDVTYSDEAIQIALDNDLTMIGTSDIHGLVDWQYDVPIGGHRPVTLVFATAKSKDAIKEALVAKRTVVWFNDLLIGREDQLMPLVDACLNIEYATYQEGTSVLLLGIENQSDVNFTLALKGPYNLHRRSDLIEIPANETTELQVKTKEVLGNVELSFEILNGITAPREHPLMKINVVVE